VGWGGRSARLGSGPAWTRRNDAPPPPDECKNVCNRPDSYTDTVVWQTAGMGRGTGARWGSA